jgi:hypothetical protein
LTTHFISHKSPSLKLEILPPPPPLSGLFTREDESYLTIFATTAVAALSNCRRFGEMHAALGAMGESLALERAAQRACGGLVTKINAEGALCCAIVEDMARLAKAESASLFLTSGAEDA